MAPLISSIYLIRNLELNEFGYIAFATALAGYFVIFCDFGYNFSATKKIAINKDDADVLSTIISTTLMAKLFLTLLGLVVSFVVIYLMKIDDDLKLLYLSFYLIVLGQALLPAWAYQGLQDFGFFSSLVGSTKIMLALLTVYFVKDKNTLYLYPLINGIGLIIIGIYFSVLLYIKYSLEFKISNLREIFLSLKESAPLFLANVSSSVYTISITVFLGLSHAIDAVAIYTAADKIIQALKGIYQPISQALYPLCSKKFSENIFEGLKFIKIVGFPSVLTMLGFGILMFVLAEDVVLILYGTSYQESIIALKVMSMVPFLISLSNIFGVQILLCLNESILFRNIIAFCSIFCLCILIYWFRELDAVKASFAVLCTELIITILTILFALMKVRNLK